ncbi:unnamed protein product, partial [Scytosiphon promiscuus]
LRTRGRWRGDNAVLLFATDLVRKLTPRYKLLKRFDKVRLSPEETKQFFLN